MAGEWPSKIVASQACGLLWCLLQTDLRYCCMLLQNQHYMYIYIYVNTYHYIHSISVCINMYIYIYTYIHSSVSVNNQSDADYADFATAAITTQWFRHMAPRHPCGRHKRLRSGADGKVTWIRACPGRWKSLFVRKLLKQSLLMLMYVQTWLSVGCRTTTHGNSLHQSCPELTVIKKECQNHPLT